MVRSLGPGAKPRQRLQRAVRETVKETARVAAVRALHIPPEVRTDEHLDKISRALSQSTFFATLDAGVTREVCRYLGLITAEHGQTLCRQGEVGDCMYFIMEGRVNVMVRRKGKDEDSKVDSMSEGACFGQLALVNADGDSDENHRRSATCRASGPCVLAVLLRDDYRRLVAQAVRDLHDKLVAALRTIPPLSAAPRAELQKAAVMMRTRPITYAKGEFIAEETTPAEKLVFLSEGTVVVKSQGKIVRQMVVNSMEMVGAHCLLHDEVFANSIITGSVVSGYTLPPHLARKLLSTRSVTAAVEAKHREEQALYSERVEKSTETAQLRSSLIVGRALQAAKKHEKALHPAVRSGRRHLFPDGKLNHLKVPDYRSPKSFEDNTACVHQVRSPGRIPRVAALLLPEAVGDILERLLSGCVVLCEGTSRDCKTYARGQSQPATRVFAATQPTQQQ